MLFTAYLTKRGLQPGTVKSYMAAIRFTQIGLGMGDPQIGHMLQLEYVLKGMKRLAAPAGQRKRLPITPAILQTLKTVWETGEQFDSAMLWAASCLCFFGFLRSGEVVAPSPSAFDPNTHLAAADVRVDSHSNPQRMEVRIKASKTDPYRQGFTLHLGRTGMELCPVTALLGYLARRGNRPGPLFLYASGQFLTRESFVSDLRQALERGGVQAAQYAGHSFRIGAATTAALAGVPDSLIKTMGRWKSEAYTLYIRTPSDQLCSVSAKLATGHSHRTEQ